MFSQSTTPLGRGETDNCRKRLLKYCIGRGLDLGCGNTKIKPEAIGIDLYSQTADMSIDARILKDFPNNHFDFVFSSHLLEEIDDTESTLKEWLRVVKPGGHIVLYQADRDFYYPMGHPNCNQSHKKHFYWEDLWKIFEKIGDVQLVDHNRYDQNANEWSFELVVQKTDSVKISSMSSVPLESKKSPTEINKSLSMNMIFWGGGDPDRLRNLCYTWKRLLDLSKYLADRNIRVSNKLYDFSEEKVAPFDGVVHIPTPKGEYKKSWKINRAIEANRDYDLFSMFDTDVFFNESHYEKIYEMITSINPSIYYTFNLTDVLSLNGIDFQGGSCEYGKMATKFRHLSALGGSYIIHTQRLFDVGGFDERFVVWGGEDDDITKRLNALGLKRIASDFSPYHLPHSRSPMNEAYTQKSAHYQVQLHILKNDETINRGFIRRTNV